MKINKTDEYTIIICEDRNKILKYEDYYIRDMKLYGTDLDLTKIQEIEIADIEN